MTVRPAFLRAAEVQALTEVRRPHPLDSSIVRHTHSLGDAVGLETIGVHLVRLLKGDTSSVLHMHHQDEEWIYILSGQGVAAKFLGQHVVSDETVLPKGKEKFGTHSIIARSVSTVTSHPGKTLCGCSYATDVIGRDGKPI